MAPRKTENNTYAKFWGDKQRALWYVKVFSGVLNCIWPTFYQSYLLLVDLSNSCSKGDNKG